MILFNSHKIIKLSNNYLKMSLKGNILNTLTLIDSICVCISSAKFNQIPEDLPDLNLLLARIKAKFESLLPDRVLDSINHVSTDFYLKSLGKYLLLLQDQVKPWKGNLKESQEEELAILLSKLQTLSEFLEVVPYVSSEDLFLLDKSHPRWQSLQQITEIFHAESTEKIKKKYYTFMSQVAMGQAFVSRAYEEEEGIKRKLMLGLGSMYYVVFRAKALRRTHLLYAKPRLDVAIHVWNLLETKMIRALFSMVIKSIHFNKVLYVPKTASHVLSPYELLGTPPKLSLVHFEDSVMFRVLSTENPPMFSKTPTKIQNKLIFHIHGGGFISMSSASHQVYTRIWSRDTQIPVVSVDYRRAPQSPYPAALDDVWQAWNWIMNQGETQVGINPEQYVIVGDSAGGNLTLALTYKIIKAGLRPPSGLILAYPAVNLDENAYSPSLMNALEDLLVPHTFLKLCLRSYLQNWEDITDPTVSPIYIEDEILRMLPPVRIMVGADDPLHDECIRFAERLLNCNVDTRIAEYSGGGHGGLNYAFKGGIKEAHDMVNKGTEWIKELLGG